MRNLSSRFDTIVFGIGFGAEFGNHDSVHAYLSAADQIFRMAARRNSRARNNFLKAFEHEIFRRRFLPWIASAWLRLPSARTPAFPAGSDE